jgi:hypothetical protein
VSRYLPLLSHLFGLKPWEVDLLDVQQWRDYRSFADAWLEARGGNGRK